MERPLTTATSANETQQLKKKSETLKLKLAHPTSFQKTLALAMVDYMDPKSPENLLPDFVPKPNPCFHPRPVVTHQFTILKPVSEN